MINEWQFNKIQYLLSIGLVLKYNKNTRNAKKKTLEKTKNYIFFKFSTKKH